MYEVMAQHFTLVELRLAEIEAKYPLQGAIQREKYNALFPEIFQSQEFAVYCLKDRLTEINGILSIDTIA